MMKSSKPDHFEKSMSMKLKTSAGKAEEPGEPKVSAGAASDGNGQTKKTPKARVTFGVTEAVADSQETLKQRLATPLIKLGGAFQQPPPASADPPAQAGRFDAIILGSGCSQGVPKIDHTLAGTCAICKMSRENPLSKNRRNNVALMLRYRDNSGRMNHVMVDAGKTMRDAVVNIFPKFGIVDLKTVLFTHNHADAILGIDDLRDIQRHEKIIEDDKVIGFRPIGGPLRCVSNSTTIKSITGGAFKYLAKPPELVREGITLRRTAWLDWTTVDDNAELEVETAGLHTRVFPVYHGGVYISLCFAFGTHSGPPAGTYPLVYMSDVKAIPDESMEFLRSIKDTIDVLIVDAVRKLQPRGPNNSHFVLEEAVDLARELRPTRTILVGMSCDIGDHDQVNEELAALKESEGLSVELGFDGMHVSSATFKSEPDLVCQPIVAAVASAATATT